MLHEFWATRVFPYPQKRASQGLTVFKISLISWACYYFASKVSAILQSIWHTLIFQYSAVGLLLCSVCGVLTEDKVIFSATRPTGFSKKCHFYNLFFPKKTSRIYFFLIKYQLLSKTSIQHLIESQIYVLLPIHFS